MGRDPAGGRATNLVPANAPQDIYQDVADLGNGRIQRDADRPGPDQEQAKELIDSAHEGVLMTGTSDEVDKLLRRVEVEGGKAESSGWSVSMALIILLTRSCVAEASDSDVQLSSDNGHPAFLPQGGGSPFD